MEQNNGRRVLIISHDVIGPKMAGPGIRYWALAGVLAQHFTTRLAAPDGSILPQPQPPDGLEWMVYPRSDWAALAPHVAWADVVVIPGDSLLEFPRLQNPDRPLVIDGYDPHTAENLFWALPLGSMEERVKSHRSRSQLLGLQCLAGDFFICASEVQRAWWLGLLEAYGRVNPYTFSEDYSLRRLVDLVPFGLPATPFPQSGPRELPGIGPEDRVLLWGGGLWEWLDPITAIRAMPGILARRPEVKLLFPGTRHPNPQVGLMRKVEEARTLARSLWLEGDRIIFGDWVPREQWVDYLRRADLGLSLHPESLETTLAFRSRLLDYVWAGLPMVVTGGDETSRLVSEAQAGRVVNYYDAEAVTAAVLELLEIPREAFQPGFAQLRETFTWERAAAPLVAFCREPRRAPDKVALGERLGSAFYVEEFSALRNLVSGYERGRFMRLMRTVQQWRQRFSEGGRKR